MIYQTKLKTKNKKQKTKKIKKLKNKKIWQGGVGWIR
jgi:hypothetical protein